MRTAGKTTKRILQNTLAGKYAFSFFSIMNKKLLVLCGVLAAAPLLFALESLHVYWAYVVPIENSVIEIYDIHYEPVKKDRPYFASLEDISLLEDDAIRITFGHNDYRIGYMSIPVFSHTETITINQTFVAMCRYGPPHYDNTALDFLKYLGVAEHEGALAYKFLHGSAFTQPMSCNYPEVIMHTIDSRQFTGTEDLPHANTEAGKRLNEYVEAVYRRQ